MIPGEEKLNPKTQPFSIAPGSVLLGLRRNTDLFQESDNYTYFPEKYDEHI